MTATEKKVGDIMLPVDEYLGISSDIDFKHAVAALKYCATPRENHPGYSPTTVLVFENGLLVGTIRIRDLLKAIEPQYLKGGTYRGWSVDSEWAIPVFWEGLFTERCFEATTKKAKDIMRHVEFQLEPDDPVIKAVYGIAKYQTEIIPVTDSGLLVGIVESNALFAELASMINPEGGYIIDMERFFRGKSIDLTNRKAQST